MARTKQTARRSTGGIAPRRQMSTMMATRLHRSALEDEATITNPFSGNAQIALLQEQGQRTIVVEGTSEFQNIPDHVQLSFLIEEISDISLENGIQKVLSKIAQARKIAVKECGLSNDNVSSDSIGSKMKKIEVGYYESVKRNNNDNHYEEVFRLHETKIEYNVHSVLRITLDTATSVTNIFSKLCYKLLSQIGLRTHEAPIYQLSNLTELRNLARKQACENAKSKAQAIIDALGKSYSDDDDTDDKDDNDNDEKDNNDNKTKTKAAATATTTSVVRLGPPLCLTDLFVNISDDAQDSFLGNWSSRETTRHIIPKPNNNNNDANDTTTTAVAATAVGNQKEEEMNPPQKRSRTMTTSDTTTTTDEQQQQQQHSFTPLDDSVVDQIFAVPSITVAARIQAMFEISCHEEAHNNNIK